MLTNSYSDHLKYQTPEIRDLDFSHTFSVRSLDTVWNSGFFQSKSNQIMWDLDTLYLYPPERRAELGVPKVLLMFKHFHNIQGRPSFQYPDEQFGGVLTMWSHAELPCKTRSQRNQECADNP